MFDECHCHIGPLHAMLKDLCAVLLHGQLQSRSLISHLHRAVDHIRGICPFTKHPLSPYAAIIVRRRKSNLYEAAIARRSLVALCLLLSLC